MIYPLCITLVTLKGRFCVCARVCVCTYIYLIFYTSKPKGIFQNSIQIPFCASQLLFLYEFCWLGFRHLQVL